MNEVLTRAEMDARFDGEWVLIADPEMDENREVRQGRAIFHGKDREAMYDYEDALRIEKAAYLYLGPMPERIWLNAEQFYCWGERIQVAQRVSED